MSEQIFVYGTLHPERAPKEIKNVVSKFKPVGKGTIRGRLVDLGEYPALKLTKTKSRVEGNIFALPEDPSALRALDKYEEFVPGNPGKSLFVRVKKMVTFANGERKFCWVYIYNRELPAAS
jgi:gamma-glutamylcyclotransferase (GGCT)/AIG2-like uncharacterized protein YtfP